MLRNRFAARLTLALIGVVVPAGCIAVLSFVKTRLKLAPIPQPPPKFRVERQKLPGELKSLSCSPNGGAYCFVTKDATLYVFTRRGIPRYSTKLPDVTTALVTDDAAYAVAYSHRDPSRASLTFLDYSGRVIWKLPLRGAVWCTNVFGGAQRSVFVVGTGSGYVYVVEIGPGVRKFKRFRVPGAVSSIALDPRDKAVFVATWQRSTINRCTLSGRRLWQVSAKSNLVYEVHPSGLPDRALACGKPLVSGISGELCAAADGAVLWRRNLDCQTCTNVVFACQGDYLCLAEESAIEHEGRSVKEKRAVLLDGFGRTVVDKGSLFFSVYPLMATRQGGVLLCGNEKALFSMNSAGKIEKVASLPSRILSSAVASNGSLMLLECQGRMLLRITLLAL